MAIHWDARLRGLGCRLVEFESRVADIAEPACRILLQATAQQIVKAGRRRGRQRRPVRVVADDRRENIGDGTARKGSLPRQHFEQHAAERPDVRPTVHRLSARLLRTHIGGRAEDDAGFGRRRGHGRRALEIA